MNGLNSLLVKEFIFYRGSNTNYEKPMPVLRMAWQPSNNTPPENADEISRRQKEIESQQIDEWMIAQGATLPVQSAGTEIKVPRLSSEFNTVPENVIDSKHAGNQVESLTLTNMENHSQTMLVLPATHTSSSSISDR